MTITLTSIAEVSNVFSIVTVFLVCFAMVIFILRLHGDDFRMSNSSVTYVQQMPVQQTPMIQINNPFIFKLMKTDKASANIYDVTVSISSQSPWILHVMWGVNITDFHSQLSTSWPNMRDHILARTYLASSTLHQGSLEYNSPCNALEVCFSPPDNYQHNQLGISPRLKYPLIVILLRDEQLFDSHELGAMINVIHIRDEMFTMPSYVMAQYLKMADGLVTTLKPLYVVSTEEELEESQPRSSETLCVVCQSEVVTRALLPCRHVCTCQGCFSRLDKCPLCRSHIYSFFCIREEPVDPNSATEVNNDGQPLGWRRRYELWNEWVTQLFGLS